MGERSHLLLSHSPSLPLSWVPPTVIILLAVLVFTTLAIARHEAYGSGRHDLEIYLQTTWNTAQGRPFATTLLKTNDLHLAEHLALVLLPLAPLYGLVPEPRLLLALQQLALGVAGLPLWMAARRLLGPGAASVVLAAFLLMPALAGVALDDFHAVAFTAVPLGGAAWLLWSGRWRAGLVLALTAVLIEEEAALVVGGMGLWLLLARRWRLGGGLLVGGAALLMVATLLVMPGFHHPGTLAAARGNRALNHFAELRADPTVAARRLAGERGLDGLVSFLLPTGGAALLAPPLLAANLPTFAALFLQDRADTFHRHWTAPTLPLLWLAAIVGLAHLPAGSRRRALGLAAVALGTLAAYLLASPLPGGRAFDAAELERAGKALDLDRVIAVVPPRASVAASANVAAHLANRPDLYIFPVDDHYLSQLRFEDRPIDAYVLDLSERLTQRVSPGRRSHPLQSDPPYVAWSSGQKVLMLTRHSPTPHIASGATFNQRLKLIGYDVEQAANPTRVTLYWQKTAGIFADFDRLAELIGPDGRVVARDQNLPLTNLFTTEEWRTGQVVIDRISLPTTASGPLTLRLAWLNRDRRTPLLLDEGGDALELPLQAEG